MGGATRCGCSAGMTWLFGGDLEIRGNTIHHPDGDLRNGSATWSTMADVARPPRAVFLLGGETEMESSGGCGEAPARLCLCETARQPVRGPDLVFSSCQVECGFCSGTSAMGPAWRWPFGVVRSSSLGSPLTRGHNGSSAAAF